MNIAEIMSALPEDWVEQEICRTQKRLSNREKRKQLDPYQVGEMRLREMHIGNFDNCTFTDEQVAYIGQCSIDRKYIIVGKVGNCWTIERFASYKCREFRGHGYIVKGKKVISLSRPKQGTMEQLMDAFESRDTSKPVEFMNADEIFSICKGKRFRKKPGDLARKEYCEKHGESVVIETRNKPKRGERVHLRALMRKSKTVITFSGL